VSKKSVAKRLLKMQFWQKMKEDLIGHMHWSIQSVRDL